jgi:two-component system alkaline phosphatase synthesis response regulator PhoP
MATKILLVDDEKDIVEFLQYNLEQEGFEVISANDGLEAINKIKEEPDLIILDVMMPKMDGFEAFKRIRSISGFEEKPIIFLTAKSGELDEVKGLEIGADDYIQKPISPKLLVARVKSNLRKLKGKDSENTVYKIGPITIDRDQYKIYVDGENIIFPKKEFEILAYLSQSPGKVFPREKILSDVWGSDIFVVERTIDVHVRKIREKLGKHADLIETVKGVGYRFKII